MHLLGTSVLTLILLPLAFSCGHDKQLIRDNYDNIIRARLRHVVDSIERRKCTVTNVCMSKKPLNTHNNVLKVICKITQKLNNSETQNEQLNGALNKLVKETIASLGCLCKSKEMPKQQKQKLWKLCKVKQFLAKLQTCFEQYNAYQSLKTDLPERGIT